MRQPGRGAYVTGRDLAVPTRICLRPDPTRVLARLFLAGQEFAGVADPGRTGLADRVLALDAAEVDGELAALRSRFDERHDDLGGVFLRNGVAIAERVRGGTALTPDRLMLLGAAYTCEQSIEAAALCNPSMVAHPDQAGVPEGGLRFIMSVRGIAEGHRSSIGFRTGAIDADGIVSVEPAEPHPVAPVLQPGPFRRTAFHQHLRELGQDGEGAASVLDQLDDEFTIDRLEHELNRLRARRDNPRAANHTADRLREFAERTYTAQFSEGAALSRRVHLPAMLAESHGVEDARFVHVHGARPDGGAAYLATYTAYDGRAVSQQLLETTDFATFRSAPLLGAAAANKGLAIFPRRIGGRFVAMSRHDRETNSISFTDDLHFWEDAIPLDPPQSPWEVVQVGNCGAPIETPDGWLVLTHGVGLMRTYSIGALLLDLDDPTIVLGRLVDPLLSVDPMVRDGYVPNVVYSCGGLVHNAVLVIPYGIADCSIGVATVPLAKVLAALEPVAPSARRLVG